MRMASAVVLLIVFVFDVIAFALAVVAEQRRSQAWVQKDNNGGGSYCVYGSDISTGLGVGSMLFLFASQLLIMAVSQCLCCGKALRPSKSRSWAIILFVTCWVTFLIAEICLLAGSARNAYHTKYARVVSNNPPTCDTLRKGVFGAGAAFIVFTGIFSELYYVYHSKANDSIQSHSDTGIRMGTY